MIAAKQVISGRQSMDIKNKNKNKDKTVTAAAILESEKFLEYCDFCNGLKHSIFDISLIIINSEDSAFNAFLCKKHKITHERQPEQ